MGKANSNYIANRAAAGKLKSQQQAKKPSPTFVTRPDRTPKPTPKPPSTRATPSPSATKQHMPAPKAPASRGMPRVNAPSVSSVWKNGREIKVYNRK